MSSTALTGEHCLPILQGQNETPRDEGTCPGPSLRTHAGGPHLDALVQEGIPDAQENVADETVCKDHKEPVEGDEGEVHSVLPQVRHQLGQLL